MFQEHISQLRHVNLFGLILWSVVSGHRIWNPRGCLRCSSPHLFSHFLHHHSALLSSGRAWDSSWCGSVSSPVKSKGNQNHKSLNRTRDLKTISFLGEQRKQRKNWNPGTGFPHILYFSSFLHSLGGKTKHTLQPNKNKTLYLLTARENPSTTRAERALALEKERAISIEPSDDRRYCRSFPYVFWKRKIESLPQ